MRMRIIIILASVASVAAGCGGSDPASSADRTPVVAAFYPLAYAAERLGIAGVEVTNLTPPGAEPHDAELSARDVERVRDAELVLYLGSGFQPALEDAVEGARGKTLDLLEGLAEGGDPHVWLDPIRYAEIVERVAEALGQPEAAEPFTGELAELDRELQAGLADCERRELVTSHDAFGYLAKRYGLQQIALTGISPEAEPSARELEGVIAAVREHGATTVFFETLVSPELAETVAREAGIRTAVLNPLEGLTEEELDAGVDYFSVLRANLATLREALGCR